MKLSVEGVSFSYSSENILNGVSFEINKGEMVGIIGPNGSGKTTLLKCINLSLRPHDGVIHIDDCNIESMKREAISKEIGVVPQNNGNITQASVFDVVLMGRTPYLDRFSSESSKDVKIAIEAMRITDIAHLAEKPVDEISGGEKQRAVIAMALTQEPSILLLDEPTLQLDISHQLEIMNLIKELSVEKGITVIFVTHDINVANRYGDKIILLKNGLIKGAGAPGEIITTGNLKDVYNIEAEIHHNTKINSLVITPIAPVK